MGTRGAICLVVDDQEKVIYNHWDSYPSGLGGDVLNWLRDLVAAKGEDKIREQVRALKPVPDREPTIDEFERLAEFADKGAGGPEDHWYRLLRRTQGDVDSILRAGLYEDAGDFPLDSLFCEWAYVVDFDARQFEVYEGFQHGPARRGRWAGQNGTTEGYGPVDRVSAWGFDALPDAIEEDEL